jgi:hypothetical protein
MRRRNNVSSKDRESLFCDTVPNGSAGRRDSSALTGNSPRRRTTLLKPLLGRRDSQPWQATHLGEDHSKIKTWAEEAHIPVRKLF